MHHRPTALALALLAFVALTGCGDDDDATTSEPTEDSTPAAEESASTTLAEEPGEVVDGTLTVTAVDYAFAGLPESVPAGTQLRLDNTSEVELHELVAFRLPENEARSADELGALPEEELDALFAGPPATVLVQAPGGEPMAVFGDGTLAEPGRYLFICTIPTDADPDEYLAAAAQSQGGPVTGVAGGPPHLVHGMVDELTVDAAS